MKVLTVSSSGGSFVYRSKQRIPEIFEQYTREAMAQYGTEIECLNCNILQ